MWYGRCHLGSGKDTIVLIDVLGNVVTVFMDR